MRTPLLHLLLVFSAGWVGCSNNRAVVDNSPRDFSDAGLDGIDAGCRGNVCSRDLRSIRTCSGDLVKECEAAKACGNGDCIAPCEAAAINQGSMGCSFAVPFPVADSASCYAFFVANNWTSPATIRLQYKGEEIPVDGQLWEPFVEDGIVKHRKLEGPLPPRGGAVVFLSNELVEGNPLWTSCPLGIKPFFTRTQALRGTGIANAIFASADVPVSMYALFPYGGAKSHYPSGTLLLPTTSFRKNYIVTSSWGGNSDTFGQGLFGGNTTPQVASPTVQIVAVEDDTAVRLLPKVAISGGRTIPASAPNTVANYVLKRGEILQLIQQEELTGSVLESTKPVGVFGGHEGAQIPRGNCCTDVENKQIPPLAAWGHEYAVLPAPDRVRLQGSRTSISGEPSVIRIVGAAAGTALTYEPRKPEGAPDVIGSGDLARFFAREPFVVHSQGASHPFYVATVMMGASTSKATIGDPETATAIPTDQWLDSYGFFSDYSYMRSAIFVTRRRINGSFSDVSLDCAGALTQWEPITFDYEWTYVELTRSGRPQIYPAGTCFDGPHQIRSDGPFALTVWGLSLTATYSYPGGMGLRTATPFELPVH